MVWPLIVAGMAAGAYKGWEDKQKEKRQRKQAAQIARWTPWTGMQPNQIQEADMTGSVIQGGLTGASLGQSMDTNAAYQDWLKKSAAASASGGGAPSGQEYVNGSPNPSFRGPPRSMAGSSAPASANLTDSSSTGEPPPPLASTMAPSAGASPPARQDGSIPQPGDPDYEAWARQFPTPLAPGRYNGRGASGNY